MLSLENHLQQVQNGEVTQPGYDRNGSNIPTGKEDQSEVTAPLLILITIEPSDEE
jgi:hypothetical protein